MSITILLPIIIALLPIPGVGLNTIRAKNYLNYILCLEIIMAGVNLGFIATSWQNADPHAAIYAALILGMAAAEIAVGLVIILFIHTITNTSQISTETTEL